MYQILLAEIPHTLAVGDVIFAIGKYKATLQKIRRIVGRIVETRCYPQPEEIAGMPFRVIQSVHIRSQVLPKSMGQFSLVADGSNGCKARKQGGETLRFDGSFIHELFVKMVNFPFVGSARLLFPDRFSN